MTFENFLKEAKGVLDEVDSYKNKIKELQQENVALKSKLVENIKIINGFGKTIEETNQLKKEKINILNKNSYLIKIIGDNKEVNEKLMKKLKEFSFAKSSYDALKEENVQLKNKLNEKLGQIEKLSAKIDCLTRTMVKGDKFIHDLKASYDSKQKEVDFLTKQVRFLTSDQKIRLSDLKRNLEDDARLITALKSRVGELKSFENIKDEKNVELKFKNDEISRLSNVANQFRSRAETLEELNKRLVKENQELTLRIGNFEKDKKNAAKVKIKQKEFAFKELEREIEERLKGVPQKIGGFAIDEIEMNEIISMVKTALAHGDSLNNIKNSLLASGYKEEKIEKCLARL